jgi:hypothetical protein
VPINPFDLCTQNLNVGSEHLQAPCHLENYRICRSARSWRRDSALMEGTREEDAGCAGKNFRMGGIKRDRPVCLVCLVYLVHLVSFVQPNKRDKPNKPNNDLLLLRGGEEFFRQFRSAFDFHLRQNSPGRFCLDQAKNLQRFPVCHSLDSCSRLLGRHTFIHFCQLR